VWEPEVQSDLSPEAREEMLAGVVDRRVDGDLGGLVHD